MSDKVNFPPSCSQWLVVCNRIY